mmetsp:Transcript_6385/g.13382  ORF Transcript_6385/g.13382 Transcript_6385/m.13382 type:complete len:95 (+) Transcript_6385:802-1086(+)
MNRLPGTTTHSSTNVNILTPVIYSSCLAMYLFRFGMRGLVRNEFEFLYTLKYVDIVTGLTHLMPPIESFDNPAAKTKFTAIPSKAPSTYSSLKK